MRDILCRGVPQNGQKTTRRRKGESELSAQSGRPTRLRDRERVGGASGARRGPDSEQSVLGPRSANLLNHPPPPCYRHQEVMKTDRQIGSRKRSRPCVVCTGSSSNGRNHFKLHSNERISHGYRSSAKSL